MEPNIQNIQKMKEQLLDLVVGKAFQYNEETPFRLSSGKTSNYYLDCRKITLIPEGMECIGRLIFEKIKNLPIQGIGGLTLGADPIAYAVMAAAYQERQYIKIFIVRKSGKEHGLKRKIEGDLHAGDRVVVVDDVLTTGQSTIMAIEKAKASGFLVERAMVLVDRQEENGMQNVRSTGVPVEALLNRDEIMTSYHKTR